MLYKAKLFIVFFLIFFFSWFFVYKTNLNSLPIQSEDTIPAIFLPLTILKEKTLYLDTYYSMMLDKYPHPDDKSYAKGLTPFYLRKVETFEKTHYVSAFPILTSVLALPVYVLPVLLGMSFTWVNLIYLSHIASALILSFTGILFYIFVEENFLKDKKAMGLTIIFLFGTINYALISQALWQQGTLQFFIILSLLYLFRFLTNSAKFEALLNKNLVLFGLFFGLAILTRPTAVIAIPFLAYLIFEKYTYNIVLTLKGMFNFFVGVIPSVLFFLWYTKEFYLNLSNNGYVDQAGSEWLGKFPEGFLGIWVSPSKGILVYSPVIIFGLFGVYIAIKNRISEYSKNWSAYLMFLLICVTHTLVLGKWKHWYGGYGYGYRMASDVIPYLVLTIVPFMKSSYYMRYRKLFYTCVIFSIFVQVHGIIFFDSIWHSAYDTGYKDTKWLWSLKDSEVAFNLRRVLVKLGILERACPKCLPHS
jgi:hypothetical protein